MNRCLLPLGIALLATSVFWIRTDYDTAFHLFLFGMLAIGIWEGER